MDGNPLKKVVSLSGLPQEHVEPWFAEQVAARGFDANELSLEQLREVLADILQDLILTDSNQSA